MADSLPEGARKSAVSIETSFLLSFASKLIPSQDKMDLIRTVRGLDQSGPGEKGENLERLWNSLTASADGKFHAAEESTLRWLLKSMNGSTKDAETLRRWPLTWTILECVFQRIPLFSLAKSLADRRFITVLQLTLKDISRPSDSTSVASPKRKRSAAKSYTLDDLRDQEGCLLAGNAVLHALKRLLGRIDSSATQSSHDKIGAEHIRSLFCTSAAEAATLTSLSLSLCDSALEYCELDHAESQEAWIETISAIWDLHLQGQDDSLEVAAHLYRPSSMIVSKLENVPKTRDLNIPQSLRTRWSRDIQTFIHRNLIIPARAFYINQQSLEPVTRALQATENTLDISAPVLYYLASGAVDLEEGKLRKGSAEWMKQVFKAVESSLRGRDDRDELVQSVLERAAAKAMPIDNDDLRTVCREYALHSETTNWRLIADIASCDPDVFQLSEQGAGLLKEVCERSTTSDLHEQDAELASRVIEAIAQGFRTGRDFSGFLKLWFQQLRKIEKQKSTVNSPWLRAGASQYKNEPFQKLIEKEMSPQQVLDLLRWLEAEEAKKSHPRALCLFLNSIAQGIRSEAYVDALSGKFFDLVSQVSKSSSTLTALKWGVVSKTLSWAAPGPEQRAEIWGSVRKPISKILSKAAVESRETYEAFKCCCQAWVSMSPDGEYIEEVTELVETFTSRLAAELISTSALKKNDLTLLTQPDTEPGYLEEAALEHYLAWFLRGSSRIGHLFYAKKGTLPQPLQNALALPSSQTGKLKSVWGHLLDNENHLNDVKIAGDLINRLVKALEEDGGGKRWPAESSQAWIQSLSGIHTDAFTRPQREQVMTLLNRHRQKATKRIPVEGWKLILGLSTKMMGRATFYEGMKFHDIVQVADAMSDLSSSIPTEDETLTDLIEAYFTMAATTVRQMAEHIEDRSIKYLQESKSFIADCTNAEGMSPFRITLLKAFVVETNKSPNCCNHSELAPLPGMAKDALSKCILSAISHFVTEKKAFESRNVIADLGLLAAVDAAETLDNMSFDNSELKQSDVRKAEKRSRAAMVSGDVRGWKMQTFLRTYFASLMEDTRPTTFHSLDNLPSKLRESLLRSSVVSVLKSMETPAMLMYLGDLIRVFINGSETDGQASAIQTVVDQLFGTLISTIWRIFTLTNYP